MIVYERNPVHRAGGCGVHGTPFVLTMSTMQEAADPDAADAEAASHCLMRRRRTSRFPPLSVCANGRSG